MSDVQANIKTDKHAAMQRMFQQYDPRSLGVMHALEGVYPAFAKKLFEGAPLMRNLVMSNYNPMDILEYPICGKCETVSLPFNQTMDKKGAWHETCKCFKCGSVTIDPPLVRDWFVDELKKRVPAEFIDKMEYLVDNVAASMLQRQKREFDLMQARMMKKESYTNTDLVYDDKITDDIKKEAILNE